ncbi:MAG: hypothetical protein Q4P07_03245 [Ornithinimicrobium sp.]|uniref:hypothetical protein n=1 Tax=Ornithinimicrobium sp. TaxID=1977084 RepID=UPI0026DF4882|nr:hypothetical protein [Ornithinimicrobium sp.]MDO5739145.1 hypothetical protein [Ornithinimicrobium sp.]
MSSPSRPVRLDSRRVLFVASDVESLERVAGWDRGSPWWPWSVALICEASTPSTNIDFVPVLARPVDGWRARLRLIPTLARAAAISARVHAPFRLVWAVKRSRALREELLDAQIVWSLDPAAAAALGAVDELLADRAVLGPVQWSAAQSDVAALEAILTGLLEDPLCAAADRVRAPNVPSSLRPLDAVVDACHQSRGRHGLIQSEHVVLDLDSAGWPPAERLTSGLAACAAAADLSLGLIDGEAVDNAQLARIVDATLDGANTALAAGLSMRALSRLGDAMSLLFHRARHSEVSQTPLVDDPESFLSSLVRSDTFRELLPPCREPGPVQNVEGPDRPQGRRQRVLVVTGAYGQFHRGVVAALEGVAEVKIRDYTRKHPHLGRKILDPTTLPRLAALLSSINRGGGALADEVGAQLQQEAQETREGIGTMLAWADVVFSDWADPATVWVSHLCPPDVRLILRIHALDALDPWLHLVAWDRIEQVVVVSQAMRSVVIDLLRLHGVSVPVEVLDVVTSLKEMARPKVADAPTTLGMIGWGRRVKDPLWAFDLVERDPNWRLVLIGPGFKDDPGPMTADYVELFRERLASPALRDRVQIVGPSRDVAEPMRQVGIILSTSLREGCHLGLVEGAASGAVPVVRNWPMLAARGGPRTLYPPEWVVDDLDAAERRIRLVTQEERWPEESRTAVENALKLFHPDRVAQDYRDLILGQRLAPTCLRHDRRRD